ncbi:MAG: hypothetical protein FJY26_09625 [Betaproteobacteria bacterium]|nr:hypothetical protein [Betaproteobacteria bacterium]
MSPRLEDLLVNKQQNSKYMWVGCSDGRVPANEIAGPDPGEVFVQRNMANVANVAKVEMHSDLNALSTIQFAVEHLRVEQVMVVGHHGCAGVRAAVRGICGGMADNWLCHEYDVRLHALVAYPLLPRSVL